MNNTDAIIKKHVQEGGRLTRDDALILAREASIHDLGNLGNARRQAIHGNKAYYVYNQHLNYTNVCQNACKFCAYSKREGQPGGYVYSMDEIRKRLLSRIDEPIREIHIVGGLNPGLTYDYFLNMLRTVHEIRPQATIKAFTAVEIAFLSSTYHKSVAEVLADLQEAGLEAMTGGGAEIFDTQLRQKICPEKISGSQWLDIHSQAHSEGIYSNCTMLFGHLETWENRIDHLQALRELQDSTGGFLCFIPLPYQPENNELKAKGPDGNDFLRTIAISRLYLDNIPHIKAYWAYAGVKAA
ncbi:MAG: CofH family radical SAM protein, partial [Desulfoplanes sp.]|nr:CofH family radical SAM protein [Desulfoplanes sp.]